MKKKTLYIIIGAIVVFTIIGGGVGYYVVQQNKIAAKEAQVAENKQMMASVKGAYENMFTDKEQKTIKLEIKSKEIKHLRNQAHKLEDKKLRNMYLDRMKSIDKFIKLRDAVRNSMPQDILKSDVNDEVIQPLQAQFNGLEEGFKPVIQPIMDNMNTQYSRIKELEALMNGFFEADVVKETIKREELDRVKALMDEMPQKDIVESYQEKLVQVQARMDEIEERSRQLLEAQRQAAVQAQIAESQRIAEENARAAASNVIIPNIPMINQKLGVLNGCEGASLLMGLQHFGYATGMSLTDIANAMPKSDDPHKGFINDIFSAEPKNVPHWIAPDALAAFGQSYYNGVANFTGASPEQLRAEIDQGNPVIIYATYGFAPEERRFGEVPRNLHVMLLYGYNSYTGSYIVADPWGGITLNVGKAQFENSYNKMRFAVAIRGGVPPVEPTPEPDPIPEPTPEPDPKPEPDPVPDTGQDVIPEVPSITAPNSAEASNTTGDEKINN